MSRGVSATFGRPTLYEALKAEGYTLPDECVDVQLRLPVNGPIQFDFIVNLTPETLAMLGRALIRMAENDAGRARLEYRDGQTILDDQET